MEKPDLSDDMATVTLRASAFYGEMPLRLRLTSPWKPIAETAADCCYWSLPQSYLRELSQHLGLAIIPICFRGRSRCAVFRSLELPQHVDTALYSWLLLLIGYPQPMRQSFFLQCWNF